MQVFLVDDASTDGTYGAIQEAFPKVRLIRGTGTLFWNRSMHLAFGLALKEDFDYFLWLNDDTLLEDAALSCLLDSVSKLKQDGITAIVAGNTKDPLTQRHTYGGIVKGFRLRPAAFQLAAPSLVSMLSCDTMNGNCTLIPRSVASTIGNLDDRFSHNFGDIDYGLRAVKAGFAIYMTPGFIGVCRANSDVGTWKDRNLSLRNRFSLLASPKGCPWGEWLHFTKRHLGMKWLLYAPSPYVKVTVQALLDGKL